jgi:hypothetical protein
MFLPFALRYSMVFYAEGVGSQYRLPACRPALGERRLIQTNFGRLVHAIANELLSWQEDHAVKATELLFRCLPFLEDHVALHLHKLLPTLCKVKPPSRV